jgi:peroxiredoxin
MANENLTARSNPLAIGDAAPDFALPDQFKKDWRLSDAVKKGDVALCFFPMAFTSVCSTEMKCVNDEMESWQKKGATVAGISCDSFAVLKAWAEQMGLKQTLLSDMHRAVCKGYGLHWAELNVAKRGTVVIGKSADGKGRVKWVQAREPGKAMNWEEVVAWLAA